MKLISLHLGEKSETSVGDLALNWSYSCVGKREVDETITDEPLTTSSSEALLSVKVHMKRCAICGVERSSETLIPLGSVRPNVAWELRVMKPDIADTDYVCLSDMQQARGQHVERLLRDEKGELTALEKDVLSALYEHELLSEHPEASRGDGRTFGERVSDRLASFGGSWRFIILFGTILAVWIALNSLMALATPFDPYPFILLNLILSCLAAIQAPIIMMSQNRQEAKDRRRAEYDYRINLKAELEIQHLHEKVDHLLKHQWERLVEIQQIQIEILNELMKKSTASPANMNAP